MKARSMAVAALAVAGFGGLSTQANAQLDLKDAVETVGAMMLADRLGIDPNLVLMAKMSGNASVYDMAPAFALSPYTQVPPAQLYAMNQAGMSWNQVAALSGVPTTTYRVLETRRQFEPDVIWVDEFSDRYTMPEDRLWSYRNAGYTWAQISRASVLSQETGVPMDEILYRHRVYGDWGLAAYRGASRPVAYARYYDPIYIPARRQSVSYLPPARYRYSDWRDDWDWDDDGVVYVDDRSWAPRTVSVRRPVVIQLSPVRVIQDPVYVRYVQSKPKKAKRVWYEPVFVQRAPIRFASNDRYRVITSPLVIRDEPREFIRRDDSGRYVQHVNDSWRAQRIDDRDRVTNGDRHVRINQRDDLQGRERGMAHKRVGGIGQNPDPRGRDVEIIGGTRDARPDTRVENRTRVNTAVRRDDKKSDAKVRAKSDTRFKATADKKASGAKRTSATKSSKRTSPTKKSSVRTSTKATAEKRAAAKRSNPRTKSSEKRSGSSVKSTQKRSATLKRSGTQRSGSSVKSSQKQRSEARAKRSGGSSVRLAGQTRKSGSSVKASQTRRTGASVKATSQTRKSSSSTTRTSGGAKSQRGSGKRKG